MSDIGFYIVDNIYVKNLSKHIPFLTYYLTKTVVKVKCKKKRHTSFEPIINSTENYGNVRIAYVKFKLNEAKNDSEKMKAIIDCYSIFIKLYPKWKYYPAPVEFLIKKSMLSHFANTQFCIDFMNKFIKICRVYNEDTLSYLDPNFKKDFVKKYNIIIRNGLKKDTAKFKYDISIFNNYSEHLFDFYNEVIDGNIEEFVLSRLCQDQSKMQKYYVDKLLTFSKEIIWNIEPIYIQYEFERLVDFFEISSASAKKLLLNLYNLADISNIPILNNIEIIRYEYIYISLSNAVINMSYLHSSDMYTNQQKHNITFKSLSAIIKLIININKYYSKNFNTYEIIPYYSLNKIIYELTGSTKEDLKYSNYSPGSPINIEIPFVTIPKQKITDEPDTNKESDKISYYIYYEDETYR
jgi:hypothetical protein